MKPFALEELLARVRALLRRAGDDAGASGRSRFADLRLDPVTYEVSRGERPVELTRTEHLLLELFLQNPRRVLSREVIFERVWELRLRSRARRRSTSTSATCGARPRPTASRG